MKHIYVASSWRNPDYDMVRDTLIAEGFDVYDWKAHGFSWRDIAPSGIAEDAVAMRRFLNDERSREHFQRDLTALDECYLLAAGIRRPIVVYQPWMVELEPELLYGLAARYTSSIRDVIAYADEVRPPR